MWKEIIVACLRYRNSPVGTEENNENPQSRILGAPAKIRTGNIRIHVRNVTA
jgi:hypothetical protein